MRRFRAFAVAAIAALSAATVMAQPSATGVLRVLGAVTVPAGPAANALVIALNLDDFAAVQTYTALDGSFSLPKLKNGIYRIIAVKDGFAPAVTTVAPTRPEHKVLLRLADAKSAARRTKQQEIWEIRGSLPADVLRELDAVLGFDEKVADAARFRGEMVSMTGVGETSRPAYAQTALGLESRLGDTWQVGFRGNLERVTSAATESATLSDPVAESSVMSMEVRSGSNDRLRVASTKSWWLYRDAADSAERQADVRAHNLEWERGATRVQIRYVAQDHLNNAPVYDADVIEIGGDTPLIQSQRNELGVSLRVVQESFRTAGVVTESPDVLRTAALGADGSVAIGSSLVLRYGVASRIGVESAEWAPRTGAEWKFGKKSSVFVTGMHKVQSNVTGSGVPVMAAWNETDRNLPRYSYSVGFATGRDDNNQFSTAMTVSEVDEPLRIVFADGSGQFWDGLHVDRGDVRRDVRVSARREVGKVFAFAVAASAGGASQDGDREKRYVAADLQSTFLPTRSSLGVSYRELQQPHPSASADYRSERVNVRVAQSLYLPIDVRLLLGVELVRVANSPFLADAEELSDSTRYLGGVAVKF